jgi:hypothetical protein
MANGYRVYFRKRKQRMVSAQKPPAQMNRRFALLRACFCIAPEDAPSPKESSVKAIAVVSKATIPDTHSVISR